MDKIKNIIIFLGVGAVIFLGYYFFIKEDPETGNLITYPNAPLSGAPTESAAIGTNDFLTLLLSVKSIQLNDNLFSDVAFTSLDPSHSITLVADGSEGRPNPFAPLGAETLVITGGATGR